ncbi:MAG: serine/threonine protein kinase [Anaerolineales bacterium]|nr:serine/threonine protein kinase [Anaerolineales bacterium]
MAEVYRAYQPDVERQVVVKILHCHLASTADFVVRFQREARAAGNLLHPNIVRIIDAGHDEERYYIVMDYLPGGTLGDFLRAQRPVTVDDALRIGTQLATALDYAHRAGVIHRDIKPANVLFADSEAQHAVLTDFGLARLCMDDHANLTVTGAMVGTPTYMSPEAVRGETCDARSDIYSLGVVLYEMLTGKPPYVANTPYSMMMKLTNDPLPFPREVNPALPVTVEALLVMALAKEPADRFQSASEFASAINKTCLSLQDDLPEVGARDVSLAPAPSAPQPETALAREPAGDRWRRFALLAGAMAGVAAVSILTVVVLVGIGV